MIIGDSDREPAPHNASGPWADLALTLPIFIAYHLGVIFLPVRNAADMVTSELTVLAKNDLLSYAGLTLALGGAFVATLVVLGRGHALRWERFALIALEGVAYAVAMRFVAGYVVGRVFLVPGPVEHTFTGIVMSLGAGFYEEIVFRVILFGMGLKLLHLFVPRTIPMRGLVLTVGWAVVAAGVFSGWHYVGDLGDRFEAQSFLFRWVCGLVFTAIYFFRGFAPVVWTHSLYDVWVMAL
jgi:hypothetical protein